MRNRLISALLTTAVVVAASVSLMAHHGAASFDTEKELTLKGTVTEWLWANPHCFLRIDVKDESGTVRNWNLELGNPTDISTQGYRRNTFKVGDMVTVVTQPVKNGTPVGRVRSMTLADGRKF